MTLHASAFSEFLFAGIAEQSNGMTLSLLSALARLGVDPWAEAARLAEMPEAVAVAALTALLARALAAADSVAHAGVRPLVAHADTRTLAARLVRKLPRARTAPAGDIPSVGLAGFLRGQGRLSGDSLRWWGVAIALAAMLATTFFF
jgi:hypothetical protein